MDKRMHARVSVEPRCKARFQLGGQLYDNITVSNLGRDGCCLTGPMQTLSTLSDKAMLERWELIHPALPKNAIKAKVVWISQRNRDTAGIITTGIQFLDAPAKYVKDLSNFVTTLSSH